MTTPDLICCPNSHLHQVIYGLGPYIADYPEQVWLSCIVSGWYTKCMNQLDCLDSDENQLRTKLKTDFVINAFDLRIVWDDFGSRSDVIKSDGQLPTILIFAMLPFWSFSVPTTHK
ncbi:hypothetical protein DFJ43DRAFT_1042841 [Lentinula guzmanii]|uniref:Uncharacterized protein n=1 Tax=Lentinula guzmanii TaxID=2804957 RepID=A0AA38MX09_9AGAR|nr:hypothetical protein DFJ43DRAFT_1042841 [Lentinula guzmanii]